MLREILFLIEMRAGLNVAQNSFKLRFLLFVVVWGFLFGLVFWGAVGFFFGLLFVCFFFL